MSRLASFADLFTRPTWSNVLVLVAGVVLAPGRRTVKRRVRTPNPRSCLAPLRRSFQCGSRSAPSRAASAFVVLASVRGRLPP